MLTTKTNDLEPKSYYEPDRITIVSGKDTRSRSPPRCDAEARLIANREFERYILSRVKSAPPPAPSEEPKPLAVVPNAAQDEPTRKTARSQAEEERPCSYPPGRGDRTILQTDRLTPRFAPSFGSCFMPASEHPRSGVLRYVAISLGRID